MTNNKIQHEWSVICSTSLLDKDSNNLSLINLIEQINLKIGLESGKKWDKDKGNSFPVNLVIVSRFRKLIPIEEPVNGRVKIDFVSPEEKILGTFEQGFEVGKNLDNIRIRIGVPTLQLTITGIYYFVVSFQDGSTDTFSKAYSIPLKVNLQVNYDESNAKKS